MDRILKNLVAIAITIALLTVSIAIGSLAYFYAKSLQPSSYRSFTVTADGKVSGAPDIAQFSFSVITEGGTDIAKLQEDNTKKVNQAIAYIKQNGVDSKDIATQDYNVSPRYQYSNCLPDGICPPPEIIGYTVSQTVSVKVRDFSKTGTLLSGVIKEGANSVSQLNFTIDDQTELQNQARAKAIAKAKDKAEELAAAGGFRIGRLLSIEEGSYATPMMARDYAVKESYGVGGGIPAPTPAPAIEPGSQDIVVTVTLRYEIK